MRHFALRLYTQFDFSATLVLLDWAYNRLRAREKCNLFLDYNKPGTEKNITAVLAS